MSQLLKAIYDAVQVGLTVEFVNGSEFGASGGLGFRVGERTGTVFESEDFLASMIWQEIGYQAAFLIAGVVLEWRKR